MFTALLLTEDEHCDLIQAKPSSQRKMVFGFCKVNKIPLYPQKIFTTKPRQNFISSAYTTTCSLISMFRRQKLHLIHTDKNTGKSDKTGKTEKSKAGQICLDKSTPPVSVIGFSPHFSLSRAPLPCLTARTARQEPMRRGWSPRWQAAVRAGCIWL